MTHAAQLTDASWPDPLCTTHCCCCSWRCCHLCSSLHQALLRKSQLPAVLTATPGLCWWFMHGHHDCLLLTSCRAWLTTAGTTIHITLSHKLSGRLGLLERESAAVLNAALQPLAARVLPGYAAALALRGLGAVPLFLTANDGTLLPAAVAQVHRCPATARPYAADP